MSIILAIETSSELASCALLSNGDSVIARESGGVRTHSQSVLPMVQELLAEAGVRLGDVDAIAFGAGLPVLPLMTLEAMAEACRARSGATEVLAVLDARMNEVYWAQYRFDGRWQAVIEPVLSAPGLVAPQPVAGLAACGNGFAVYPDAFIGKDFAAQADTAIVPHARDLARIGAAALAAGQGVPAAQAQPLYLRNKVAYTSAERQVINAAKAAGSGP